MKTSMFIPPEIRNLPLNVKVAALMDHCISTYHDKILDPVKYRWQADSEHYSPDSILKEIGGDRYTEAILIKNKTTLSRFLDSLFQMKGSKDSLLMMLSFLGIRAQVIDYFLWSRSQKYPELISDDIRNSVPPMQSCEVYVALEVNQVDLAITGVEIELFQRIVELFLWSCAELKSILIIRTVLDLTIPPNVDSLEMDSCEWLPHDSMVFLGSRYNRGLTYNNGSHYSPNINEYDLIEVWGPNAAPWSPTFPNSMTEDSYYGEVFQLHNDNFESFITYHSTRPMRAGHRLNIMIPVYIPFGVDLSYMEFQIKNNEDGLYSRTRVSSERNAWQLIRFSMELSSDTESTTFSIKTILNDLQMDGEILLGRPKIEQELLANHTVGDEVKDIGMYDLLVQIK
ncbi:hypothetical protein [Vibrio phage Va2]|nr:hypothetical protein [Vibrio phage Va2]